MADESSLIRRARGAAHALKIHADNAARGDVPPPSPAKVRDTAERITNYLSEALAAAESQEET